MKLTDDEMRQCWRDTESGKAWPKGSAAWTYFMFGPHWQDFGAAIIAWTIEMNDRWGDEDG